ncbi:MAG: sugar MFS transporter [Ginsengibacter sp.]
MTQNENTNKNALVIIGALFFVFGFVTWLNGPLITYVKLAFGLDTDSKAFMVTTSFYMAYFFLALPSSWILQKTGMKKGMGFALMVMAVGTFIFGQFATHRNYPMSLLGLFVIGSGLSLLQTASNPYISILGPIETAARRISIVGLCNKVAGIISPLVISAFVLQGINQLQQKVNSAPNQLAKDSILNEFAKKIYLPYIIMSVVLLVIAFLIMKSSLPEIKSSEANKQTETGDGTKEKSSIFNFPHLWLGAICIFVYVGAEVMAGDAIGTYGNGFHIPTDETKYFTSYTLAAMLLGYIIGLMTIPKYMTQQVALKYSAVLGMLFTLGAYVTHGYASVAFVAALGLANALMWPAIFPMAINGLGRFTEKGSAILIMGIAGGAIIPKAFASLKEHYDFQLVFCLLMIPCYLYILYFAVKGYKAGQIKKTRSQGELQSSR